MVPRQGVKFALKVQADRSQLPLAETYHFNEKALSVLLMPRASKPSRSKRSSTAAAVGNHEESYHMWELDYLPVLNGSIENTAPATSSKRSTRRLTRAASSLLHLHPSTPTLTRRHSPGTEPHHDPIGKPREKLARHGWSSGRSTPTPLPGLVSLSGLPNPESLPSVGPLNAGRELTHTRTESCYDVDLELAVVMAPPELTSAWARKSYDAGSFLRARTPYPLAVIDVVMAFHAAGSSSSRIARGDPRWEYALDIGCGAGQLAIHLATRFCRVFGQDVDERALALADTVKQLGSEELEQHRLPAVEDPSRITYSSASGEQPERPPGVLFDVITMGSCFHNFNASSPDEARTMWATWSSLLRPGGSLFVIGMRPVVGPYSGKEGERVKPLREWLGGFWHLTPELRPYFDSGKIQRAHGAHGLFSDAKMPWQLGDQQVAQLWDPNAYAYIPIDDPAFARPVSHDLSWIPGSALRAARRDDSRCSHSVSVTTPRRQAEWVRSTSGYAKMLRENVEQRVKAMTDEDIAAVTVRRICAAAGLGYEEDIEFHSAGVVICLRRSDQAAPTK